MGDSTPNVKLFAMIRTRAFAPSITRHSYWLAVALPLLLPVSWLLRTMPGLSWAFAWLPLLFLYGVIPLMDLLIGRDVHNPTRQEARFYPDTLIPVLAGLSYLVVVPWSLSVSGAILSEYGWLAIVGWTLSLGDIGSAVGINVAHELTHRRKSWERSLGGILLASVWYPGFIVEHPKWHHVHVSTSNDPSSAEKGSNVYTHVPRAYVLNIVKGWQLSVASARNAGRPASLVVHEVAGWYLLSMTMTAVFGLLWGPLAVGIFLAHGLLAAILLEMINFVEHYGLRREKRADGRYVPPGVTHSWDCDYWLSNAMLLQLPRHADHHTHPQRAFSQLKKHGEAPLLPLGYPLLVLIATIPPLWRSIVDPLVPESPQEG